MNCLSSMLFGKGSASELAKHHTLEPSTCHAPM